MLVIVFVVIATTATLTNGACSESDGDPTCRFEELTEIPQLPENATEVQVFKIELLVCTQQ